MKKPALFTFKYLAKDCTFTIKNYLYKLGKTPQSYNWHPEGNVLVHTKIVFNRAKKFNCLDLSLAAFYHDLGKADTTIKTAPGKYSAHDHEKTSALLVKYTRDWIRELGGDPEKIKWIVENHMRIKYIDEMSNKKRQKLYSHPWYDDLVNFKKCDSREGLSVWEVIKAGGNPFVFMINIARTAYNEY